MATAPWVSVEEYLHTAYRPDCDYVDGGEAPIFKACDMPKAVPLLARSGADLNARDHSGETPLMSCFDDDGLKALIAAGADPSLRDSQGETAADQARKLGDKDKAALLEAAIQERIIKGT